MDRPPGNRHGSDMVATGRIVADSNAVATKLVAECSESNNTCSLAVDTGPITTLPPDPIGPALRARDHGDPQAADIVATFDWSLDLGTPRAAGHHYDLLRGTDPRSLPLLAAAHPLLSLSYVDSTPAATALPPVQFYLVYPANACEVRSAD